MAQLDFFLSISEKIEIVEFCLGKGCHLIPEMHYDDMSYVTISSVAEYIEYYDKSWLFFLTHPDYTLYSLEMGAFEKHYRKKYFICQRYGGPTIDFYSPSLAEIEDNKIGPGFIGIYPFYYYEGEKFMPDPALKEIYTMICSFIKKRCIKVKLQSRYYWIGNKTIELFKEGKCKMVEFEGVDWEELLTK